MNRIKKIWCIKNFNHELMSEIQQLNKTVYSNLYQCNNTMELRQKNSILKNEINSLFQNILFDFLYEEQELYEYYDNQFNEQNYHPRNENLPFKSFIIYYKNLYLDINSNENKLKCLKKIRWYIFSETKSNINLKNDLFKSSIMMMDIDDDTDINNDLFEDNNFLNKDENTNSYNIFNCNSNNDDLKDNNIDFIKEKNENIINNELIDELFLNEDNPLLYIIKILYLSITSFCKETICYLLTTYDDDNISLINNYSKRFDNFVECAKMINSQCENINISINYLYNDLFNDYPNFPKFSVFRLFMKIWYKESTSFLIQNNNITLLNNIKNSIIELYSKNIEEDITIQNSSFISNSNNFENNAFFHKKQKLSLTSSISIFNSDNLFNNDMNNFSFVPFGSLYDDNNSKYYIIEKGLKIIYDSFCNEFNVNLLNLSYIDVNNYYNDIESSICDIIMGSVKKSFEENVINKEISLKIVINHILSMFKDYFYENRIISELKKNIFNIVYKSLKQNIFNFILYRFQLNFKNENLVKNYNNNTSSFNGESINTNHTSCFESQLSINNHINIDNIFNSDDFINETRNYLIRQVKFDDFNNNPTDVNNGVTNFLEELNKKEKISELLKEINEWNDTNTNNILKVDKKVNKELNKKNLSNKFNNLQRQLFSYSIESDWELIEKVKSLENKNNHMQNKNINININKSSISDAFNDFQSINNLNNLKPFYNEINNNDFNMGDLRNINDNKNRIDDIDLGKNVYNLDLNNNFFKNISNNDDDINPFKMEDDKSNNFNNNYFGFNYSLDNLSGINNHNLFFGSNNYDLNDLKP